MNAVPVWQTLLGKRIEVEREYRGLSQEEVGCYLGVPMPVISLIKTGSGPLSGCLEYIALRTTHPAYDPFKNLNSRA